MSKIIIASGPVIVENNKILLDKQGDDDFWKFCGGRIRDNETLSETAIRRSKEELGINIKITNKIPFITYTTKDKNDVILVHFLAKRIGDINSGKEVHEWKWFDLDKLPTNIAPNIIPVLKHFKYL